MSDMITNSINVKIVEEPSQAPAYGPDTELLRVTEAIVVANGTVSGLPTVDIQMVGTDGKKYLVMATGAVVEMLAGVIAGKRQATQEKNRGHH